MAIGKIPSDDSSTRKEHSLSMLPSGEKTETHAVPLELNERTYAEWQRLR
jgi:hypothetical protein